MNRPAPKGWCPGAYKPMMSGDGLVVRVRPVLGRLSKVQVLGLCAAALEFGSGIIDFTSRANLQIRGISEQNHERLLEQLNQLELVPDDPALEARRNILLPLDWKDRDDTHSIAAELTDRLAELPELPAKFGFAIDTGPAPVLTKSSADIRVERSETGLIVRAEGAEFGREVTPETAVDTVIELAHWFVDNSNSSTRRMARLTAQTTLPESWTTTGPKSAGAPPTPGAHSLGQIFGVRFGQTHASALSKLISASGACAMRMTPWRLFLLECASEIEAEGFIVDPEDPHLNITACPGAPSCASATVETHALAEKLAKATATSLHISGCSKGCAKSRSSALTFVGRDGAFDLVKNGVAWDAPSITGLTPDELTKRIGEFDAL